MAAEGWGEKYIWKVGRGVGEGSEDCACLKLLLFCRAPFSHERSSWLMQLSSSCHSHAVNYLSVTSREFCSWIYQFRFHSHRSTERLSKFNMSRALKSEQKEKKFYNGSWKVFTGRIANWILENLDVSRVYSYKKKFWRETFERSCRLSASRYCLWSNGISIFDRNDSSLRLRIVIWRIESAANINSYLRQQRTF